MYTYNQHKLSICLNNDIQSEYLSVKYKYTAYKKFLCTSELRFPVFLADFADIFLNEKVYKHTGSQDVTLTGVLHVI